MKLHKLSLLILLLIAQSSMGMETTSPWQTLPKEIFLYIAAFTDNKASIAAVNKQLYLSITQKNMLEKYPQSLSSQDHMNFMVKYAKKDDESMIKFGLKTASLYGHDYLNMLSFVITKDSPLLDIIATYKNNPHTEFPQDLIDPMVSLLKGDIKYTTAYKSSLKLDNPRNKERLTPLHVAVNNKHLTFAQLFLAQDPTLLNQIPCYNLAPLNNNEHALIMATPLEVAIKLNCLPLCEYLLSFKNVKLDSSLTDYTLLEWTAQYGSLNTLKLVTNRLKQKNSQTDYNSLFSAKALQLIIHEEEKQLFLINEMNYTLPGVKQPLHIIIENMQSDLVIYAITNICDHQNTNINTQDEYGNTPLFLAINRNLVDCVSYLLNKGADLTIQNKNHRTLLHAAAINGNTCIMNQLLNTNVLKKYINSQDSQGNTALFYCLENTFNCNLESLLKAGANPNTANSITGNTTLMYAAQDYNTEEVQLLLHYGADPDIKNLRNKTAYDYTINDEIRKLLTRKTTL